MENKDAAKERVEQELDELNEKIVKLSTFLYSKKIVEAKLSFRMQRRRGSYFFYRWRKKLLF